MRVVAVAFAGLASCASPPALVPAAPQPLFDVEAFFLSRSVGAGTVHILLQSPRPLKVESHGRRETSGRLILDQRISGGDKPPRVRRWVMRRAGPNRWTGTLTDAMGPVSITASGNSGLIRYQMPNGAGVEQQLRLLPGGRIVRNRLIVRQWGVRVAWVDETIRKLD